MTNVKDMAFKLFWTMANAGLAALTVYAADLDPAWGALVLAGLQLATTYVRQQLGESPPDLGSSRVRAG